MALSFQNKVRPVQGAATSTPPVPGASTTPTVSFSSKVRPISTPVASQPISTPQEDTGGGVGGFLKGLVSAPATMIARPFQAAANLGDYLGTQMAIKDNPESADAIRNADNERTLNTKATGPAGIIAPTPQNTSDVIKDVGRGIETVALGFGGPKTAMAAGGALGFGGSLEQQGSQIFTPKGVLDAGISTGVGVLGGKALNIAAPYIGTALTKLAPIIPTGVRGAISNTTNKVVKSVQDYAERTPLFGNVAKPLSEAITTGAQKFDSGINNYASKAGNKASDMFIKQYPGLSKSELGNHFKNRETSKFMIAGKSNDNSTKILREAEEQGITAEDIQNTLKNENIYTMNNSEGRKFKLEGTADSLHKRAIEEGKTMREFLASREGSVPLVTQQEKITAINKAIDATPETKLLPEQKARMKEKVNFDETNKLRPNGDSQTDLYNHKINSQNDIYNQGKITGKATSISDKETILQKSIEGKVMKELMLKNASAADRKVLEEYFKQQQIKFITANYLQSLNNKTIDRTLFQKGFRTATRIGSAIVGYSTGGPFAGIFGYQAGGVIDDMIMSANNPLKIKILQGIGKTEPEIYQIMKGLVDAKNPISRAEISRILQETPRLPAGDASKLKLNMDIQSKTNAKGAIEMGYPQRPTTPGERFNNNNKQNLNRLFNTKTLPAPEPRIITPNTQGTPNRMSKLYNSGGDKGEVGGMIQRIKPKK